MSRIIVVGSSNIDMTAMVETLPRPGETIGGARFIQANGGKGANQAVAAARLGGDVMFATCVGNDLNGKALKDIFAADGINTKNHKMTDEAPTGTALIMVDKYAENCIAVAPGANGCLTPEDMDAMEADFAEAEILLVQLEVPMPTVCRAVELAAKHGLKVVLNPAPVAPIPEHIFPMLYLITPNETEAQKLTGVRVNTADDAVAAARVFFDKGVQNVIITMGASGSILCTKGGETIYVPTRKVDAVDTTAAGDVYNGGVVTALSEGKSLEEAARFASVASSISVTRLGAQNSVPTRDEVMEALCGKC